MINTKLEIKSIGEIKPNPNNPRIIKNDKFKKLVASIKEFPKMLELRPIVCNAEGVVLGGNMRLKACKEAGLKEVPVIYANELNEDEQREFIVKDNVGFGDWDWDAISNEWDEELLTEWGLDVWQQAPEVDYSILDDEDVSGQLNDMTNGVKKAIQIEFEAEHYEEAYALVKFWRSQGDVGYMILQYLRAEKQKI